MPVGGNIFQKDIKERGAILIPFFIFMMIFGARCLIWFSIVASSGNETRRRVIIENETKTMSFLVDPRLPYHRFLQTVRAAFRIPQGSHMELIHRNSNAVVCFENAESLWSIDNDSEPKFILSLFNERGKK
jgi:hypothetical protein